MPIRLPILPPIMAKVISDASGMRHKFFRALYLSISISRNPSALIITRYRKRMVMVDFFLEGFM